MNSFHKIFFVGVIVLSVSAGNRFNGANPAGENHEVSIVVSASETAPAQEKVVSSGMVQPAIPNESTTPNDIKVNAEADALLLLRNAANNGDSNSKSAVDNGALLKPASPELLNAFRKTGSGAPPEIQAKSALIADLSTGQAYFELNPELRWPMASLTKLMTAIMVLRNADLSRQLTLPNQIVSAGEEATTSAEFFRSGDVYSGNDVFSAMLLISKNEAAETFADAYGRNDFVSGLNSLAKEFGMNSTNFGDPTGLSVANQSTAKDLQKLALNVYRDYPKILEITRKKSAAVTELDSMKKTALSNINVFAGTPGFIGGKTGYTDEADGNLLSIFSHGGRPVLMIVLGTDDRFGETSELLQWFKDNFQKS